MAGKNQITGGAFQDIGGNRLANGYLTMQLSHDEQEAVDPGLVVAGAPVQVPLDTNGNIAGTVLIWPNDQLSPADSYYTVNAFRSDGTQAWAAPQNFLVPSSPSPFNVGNWVPIGGGSPVLSAADSIQTLAATGSLGFAAGTNTLVEATAGAGGITLTLINAIGVGGRKICVKMMDTGAGGVTLNTLLAQTIDGASSLLISTQYHSYTLESDNANWVLVAAYP